MFLSAGYGVLINLATKLRPVDFSTQRCTTPNAPLEIYRQGYRMKALQQEIDKVEFMIGTSRVTSVLFSRFILYMYSNTPCILILLVLDRNKKLGDQCLNFLSFTFQFVQAQKNCRIWVIYFKINIFLLWLRYKLKCQNKAMHMRCIAVHHVS